MNSSEFFTNQNQGFYYLIGNLNEFPLLKKDVDLSSLEVQFGEGLRNKQNLADIKQKYTMMNVETNIWIGKKGVTAQLHYDAEYNFYLQVFDSDSMKFFRFKEERNGQ